MNSLKKGERVLNVVINIRTEIVEAAQGSFYLAQMLAYHTCIRSNVLQRLLRDVREL